MAMQSPSAPSYSVTASSAASVAKITEVLSAEGMLAEKDKEGQTRGQKKGTWAKMLTTMRFFFCHLTPASTKQKTQVM